MTLTKADVAQKVADDCGFMKGEATEIVEKLLEICAARPLVGSKMIDPHFSIVHHGPKLTSG